MKKKNIALPGLGWLLVLSSLGLLSFADKNPAAPGALKFPYKQAGLTEKQAAAHLLNRFTFGPKPGQVEAVVQQGLEKWFLQQLAADQPEVAVQQRLAGYRTLQLSNAQIAATYPRNGELLRLAIQDGVITRDAINKEDKQEYREKLKAYMVQKGCRPRQELYRELISQKILRAAYAQNQLQEVLTSFWFNHFNVSLTKNDCAPFVTAYERDVIRPHVLGKFETLLLATAKSPAMLTYLDNFRSMAPAPVNRQLPADTSMTLMPVLNKVQQARAAQGLNENYAREIMELHTLGVDGGYTQSDVTQAARILTGWTVSPALAGAPGARKAPAMDRALQRRGFIREGDFIFAAPRHDQGEKTVLGRKFPAGGGYAEGQLLIQMLAHHPATARFIATKLATRFVSDNPPPALVDKMTQSFRESGGDIRQVLLTMTTAPEFWRKEALREKTKSPFELAISAVRSLNAEVEAPYQLFTWITRMGERLYYYQAPTGFPDRGQYWINTGSLLNRMNFGLALASGRIPGVQLNLAALNQHREPESAEAALLTYSQYLLPERDLTETIRRLTPSLHDPEFSRKVDEAAGKATPPPADPSAPAEEMMPGTQAETKVKSQIKAPGKGKGGQAGRRRKDTNFRQTPSPLTTSQTSPMLAQVVGIIIGSPEFQRK